MKQNRFDNQAFIDRLNSDDIESEAEQASQETNEHLEQS